MSHNLFYNLATSRYNGSFGTWRKAILLTRMWSYQVRLEPLILSLTLRPFYECKSREDSGEPA